MNDFRDYVLFLLIFGLFSTSSWIAVAQKRIALLEAHHQEVVIENKFLARKLAEAREELMKEDRRRDLALNFAVNGFRTGHWSAYDSVIREARLAGLEDVGVENVQR